MPRLREPGSFLPTLLLVFSGYLLLAGGAVWLSRQPGSIATLWYANAFAVALLWDQPQRRWPPLLAAAMLADVLANLTFGGSLAAAVGFVLPNLLEITLAAALLRVSGAALRMNESPGAFLQFIFFGALLPPRRDPREQGCVRREAYEWQVEQGAHAGANAGRIEGIGGVTCRHQERRVEARGGPDDRAEVAGALRPIHDHAEPGRARRERFEPRAAAARERQELGPLVAVGELAEQLRVHLDEPLCGGGGQVAFGPRREPAARGKNQRVERPAVAHRAVDGGRPLHQKQPHPVPLLAVVLEREPLLEEGVLLRDAQRPAAPGTLNLGQ